MGALALGPANPSVYGSGWSLNSAMIAAADLPSIEPAWRAYNSLEAGTDVRGFHGGR